MFGQQTGNLLIQSAIHKGAAEDMEYLAGLTQQAIAAKDEQIRQLMVALAEARRDLAIKTATCEGYKAQAVALKDELARVDASNKMLAKTGLTYKSGLKQTFASLVYERAFDKAAIEAGLPGKVSDYRSVAK